MFHVVLRGKIITSDPSLIEKLKDLIENNNSSVDGNLILYEVQELYNSNDTN